MHPNHIVTVARPNRLIGFLKSNLLLICILISIVVGFAIGIGVKNSPINGTDDVLWLTLPGNLFIRALELLIVPVVFIGVIAATSSLSAKSNIKITLICVGLTYLTHILATVCGLFGSLILKAVSKSSEQTLNPIEVIKQKTTYDIIADILRSLIPKNLIKATTNQEITTYVKNSDGDIERKVVYIDGTNILGVLVFSLLIGISASVLDERAKLFREFFKNANEVVILVLKWLINLGKFTLFIVSYIIFRSEQF